MICVHVQLIFLFPSALLSLFFDNFNVASFITFQAQLILVFFVTKIKFVNQSLLSHF